MSLSFFPFFFEQIEIFRKSEKEMNAKVKDLKIELAGYKSHQHAAHGTYETVCQLTF
jgi:ribosomal protein L29